MGRIACQLSRQITPCWLKVWLYGWFNFTVISSRQSRLSVSMNCLSKQSSDNLIFKGCHKDYDEVVKSPVLVPS